VSSLGRVSPAQPGHLARMSRSPALLSLSHLAPIPGSGSCRSARSSAIESTSSMLRR
jgi:hypothetical protein